MKDIFNDIVTVTNDTYKILLSYMGEGFYGEYNENDKEDQPLLRAEIYCKDADNWCKKMAASTCTCYSARRSQSEVTRIGEKILQRLSIIHNNQHDLDFDLSRACVL